MSKKLTRLPKIFGEKDPQNHMRTFCAPNWTQQGKFGAIPPTDPDDISQSTPDFLANLRISGVKKL